MSKPLRYGIAAPISPSRNEEEKGPQGRRLCDSVRVHTCNNTTLLLVPLPMASSLSLTNSPAAGSQVSQSCVRFARRSL